MLGEKVSILALCELIEVGWSRLPFGASPCASGGRYALAMTESTPQPELAVAPPTKTPIKSLWWLWLVIGAVGVLVIEGAIAGGLTIVSAATTPNSFTATGTFELVDTDDVNPCAPSGGYSDIGDGAEVVVSNAAGHTLAIGSLGTGKKSLGSCIFPFTVHDVPTGQKFYGVEVTHRGAVQESEKDMERGKVALSLGN